jgi:oligopeptide/dipeptide ABC transporter ATP-binding protein
MGEPALLEVRDLSVDYKRGRKTTHALRDVTLDVMPHETVGLVGESGSGKSTLARAILGLAPIRAGAVRFGGADITRLRYKQRRPLFRRLQVVFQDPYTSLNPARTIGRSLVEPLEAFGEGDRASARRRVRAMLEKVHLPADAVDGYPHEFSGGQRQRIAIARALMLSPQVVICDEAVSALDLSVQAQIINLLRELQAASGLSYLFISHDLEVVRQLCDRVVVLYRGRVMEAGKTADVSRAPAHPYTAALLEAAPLPDPAAQRRKRLAATGAEQTTDAAEDSLDEGCPFAPRCPYAVDRCWTQRPSIRPTSTGGAVACDRYPAWLAERPAPATATSNGVAPTESASAT